jgi:hypothetical protein
VSVQYNKELQWQSQERPRESCLLHKNSFEISYFMWA